MAVPRDPAFWKRFSVAVHLDEEYGVPSDKKRPQLQHSDSWLARQNAKRSRRTCLAYTFWLSFFGFIAAVIAIIVWLLKSGVLNQVKIGPQGGPIEG